MTLDPDRLAAMEALCAAATPDSWECDAECFAFCTAVRTALPELIAECRRLRALVPRPLGPDEDVDVDPLL